MKKIKPFFIFDCRANFWKNAPVYRFHYLEYVSEKCISVSNYKHVNTKYVEISRIVNCNRVEFVIVQFTAARDVQVFIDRNRAPYVRELRR